MRMRMGADQDHDDDEDEDGDGDGDTSIATPGLMQVSWQVSCKQQAWDCQGAVWPSVQKLKRLDRLGHRI